MKRKIPAILSVLLIGVTLCPITSSAQRQRGGGTTTLDENAKQALLTALAGPEGEYAARAEYKAIVAKFGAAVRPYANIREAAKKHVAALEQQCLKYGVTIPADSYSDLVLPEGFTLLDAAAAGVAAENANVAMYLGLLDSVKGCPSLVQVFTNLRDASLDNHLPAFEAALANGGSLP